jgi:transposase
LVQITVKIPTIPILSIVMDAKQSTWLTQILVPLDPDAPCKQWQAMAEIAGAADRGRQWRCNRIGSESAHGRNTIRCRAISPEVAASDCWLDPLLGFVVSVHRREIHVILDNLSTHKKNDDWLAAHPNVAFHFTPTSASWLNQVEIWFGIFSRKALAGASFASIAQLVQAIRDFTEAYNRNAAPFLWRKREVKGAQLRNTIVNLRN